MSAPHSGLTPLFDIVSDGGLDAFSGLLILAGALLAQLRPVQSGQQTA